jgi:hypothetical protein
MLNNVDGLAGQTHQQDRFALFGKQILTLNSQSTDLGSQSTGLLSQSTRRLALCGRLSTGNAHYATMIFVHEDDCRTWASLQIPKHDVLQTISAALH